MSSQVRASTTDVLKQFIGDDLHQAQQLALEISEGVFTVNRGLMGEDSLSLRTPCLVPRRDGQLAMNAGGGGLEAQDWHTQWLLIKNKRESMLEDNSGGV